MKLSSATPASISRKAHSAKRIFIFAVSLLLAGTSTASYFKAQNASADQYDDKIASLQADMSRYQAQADALNAQANTLSNAIAQLQNQEAALQAQINVSQAQYDKLTGQIADTQKQIKDNQDALGSTIAALYVNDNISPVEMLASSQNIGDYINKQEYRNSVKTQLDATIKKVQTLKAQLTQQQTDVQKVLTDQKNAQTALAASEAQQASLLAETQNNENNYQNMIKDSQSQIAAARATQAALRARTRATGGYVLVDSGSMTGYPWNSSNCAMVGYMSTGGADGNGGDGHGYGCRQCVSYVAWRVAKETGIYYSDLGNGGDAATNLANKHGYKYLGGTPQPGSVGSGLGEPGHTAYVEDVSPDGSKILVSQYNYDYGAGYGMYSEMWLSANFFSDYTKIK
ncbi:MAG TPA: CHAP domain-containing protein [Dongiaceae bacterium]|nr:CHAP domain-containing protein [Dongiaceae bacterium]